ncbi:hypothetical protein Tco_0718679 [Tanacetum coccineum]
MDQAVEGPAELWKCWPRQSSVWSVSQMQQVSSLKKTRRMPALINYRHLDVIPVRPPPISHISKPWSWPELVMVVVADEVPMRVPDPPSSTIGASSSSAGDPTAASGCLAGPKATQA